jgi:hypothetical protein
LKINLAAGVWRELVPAFPDGTRHALVTTHRDRRSQDASLHERQSKHAPVDLDAIRAYLDVIERATDRMGADAAAAGWPVARVRFEDVQADPRGTWEPVLAKLGLTPTAETWTIYDPTQVRHGRVDS